MGVGKSRKASELRRKLLGGPSALLVDPLGFEAGDSNLYRYVNNGPTGAIDPSGDESRTFTRTFSRGKDEKIHIDNNKKEIAINNYLTATIKTTLKVDIGNDRMAKFALSFQATAERSSPLLNVDGNKYVRYEISAGWNDKNFFARGTWANEPAYSPAFQNFPECDLRKAIHPEPTEKSLAFQRFDVQGTPGVKGSTISKTLNYLPTSIPPANLKDTVAVYAGQAYVFESAINDGRKAYTRLRGQITWAAGITPAKQIYIYALRYNEYTLADDDRFDGPFFSKTIRNGSQIISQGASNFSGEESLAPGFYRWKPGGNYRP
jgi:hypothetical protein